MFNMNPNAKEFIPASILKKMKEQEEANKLGNLTNQMSKIDIKKDTETEKNCSSESKQMASNNKDTETLPQSKSTTTTISSNNNTNATSQQSSQTNKPTQNQPNNNDVKNSHSGDTNVRDYQQHLEPEDYSSFNPEEEYDEHCYLATGENVCEFNGEQFIIPNDDDELDEYDIPPQDVAYDFGNDEDNEDDEVCKAFEQFLGGLPQ